MFECLYWSSFIASAIVFLPMAIVALGIGYFIGKGG